MKAYIVRTIRRTPADGFENSKMRAFATIDEASTFIQEYISQLYKEKGWHEFWDEDDFNQEAPLADKVASVERLLHLLKYWGNRDVLVWGPKSKFFNLAPIEILIAESE